MNEQQTTLMTVSLTLHREITDNVLSYHITIVADTSKYHLYHPSFEQLLDHVIALIKKHVTILQQTS